MKTLEAYDEIPKYEFSLCHQCKKLHVNVEDGLCKLCLKN